MMKFTALAFAVVGGLLNTASVRADTITLKDGSKIEGKILRDVGEEYVMEVNVSETIRDERRVKKSEVARVDKETEEMKAFAVIEKMVPTDDHLAEDEYERRIEAVEGFVRMYPEGSRAVKAKEMLDILNAEHGVISTGGLKHEGEITPGDEYQANRYELDAGISRKEIEAAVARRDLLGALRLYTKHLERFGMTAGRGDLDAEMLKVTRAFQSAVVQSLATVDGRLEKREEGLERMAADDRAAARRALEDQTARMEARFQQEKTEREAWVTPDAFHKESLTEAQRQAEAEVRRLEAPAAGSGTEAEVALEDLYRSTWKKVGGGADEEKVAMIAEAKTKGLPDEYVKILEEKAGLAGE